MKHELLLEETNESPEYEVRGFILKNNHTNNISYVVVIIIISESVISNVN